MYICGDKRNEAISFKHKTTDMKKSKLILAGMLSALAVSGAQAQVKDVSVTISPFVEYNWWNKNIALKNTPFYGARVGFGFGPFFEIRGTFEKSLNLKNALEKQNILSEDVLKKLDGMPIDITRVGGELKVNILGNYVVSPYITGGAGVQIFDYNPFDASNANAAIEEGKAKEKQLYLSLGAGLKLSLSDRVALSIEGRNIQFNWDAENPYTVPGSKDDTKKGNWGVLASLDFYLGGNTTAQADKYGRAYRNLFSDGFVGPKFVLEPGIAFVDFKNKTGFKDHWFMGGSAGVDFSSLLGIRAFYYQATKEANKLDFNFNKDVKMYGANIIARLNVPRGIVPYLQLGAGYLDNTNLLENSIDADKVKKELIRPKQIFALAGAGVEIPVSRFFALYGTVNSMLFSNKSQLDINKPSDISSNIMYTTGLRVNLGVPAKAPVYNPETGRVESVDNDQLNETVKERVVRRTIFGSDVEAKACKQMTKREFEEMVDRILNKIRKEENLRASEFSDSEMNVILTALNQEKGKNDNQALVNEVRNLVQAIEHNGVVAKTPATTTTVITPAAQGTPATQATMVPAQAIANDPEVVYNGTDLNKEADRTSFLKLNRAAIITGVNFGESTLWNLGLRGYMQVSNTALDFMPELFFGVGNKNGYGISANLVYNFDQDKKWVVSPYAGLGLGLFNHGNGATFGPNFIGGVNINAFGDGAFFADYSARDMFKNNQIAIGYRFVF